MTDIVERLRHAAHDSSNTHLSCLEEAADTIEALQSALHSREAECERLRGALSECLEIAEQWAEEARASKSYGECAAASGIANEIRSRTKGGG